MKGATGLGRPDKTGNMQPWSNPTFVKSAGSALNNSVGMAIVGASQERKLCAP